MLTVSGLYTNYIGDKGTLVKAAQDVSFEIPEGKLFTLLGPSGCGKTTTLRSIAGLERPSAGTIQVNGRDVYNAVSGVFVPPNSRGFGMVFQSYAIWPHMTVYQNASFPLEVGNKKLSSQEIRNRVMGVLESVELDAYHDRFATKLSGGQQQRLALARALIMEPQLLLLDEPLSNLDSKLREKMRFELKKIQRELGITTVYVTHDQSEALALSHEIAVMRNGRIMQRGTPREIYEKPNSEFVADFIGTINFIQGSVRGIDKDKELLVIESEMGPIHAPLTSEFSVGDQVQVCVRPEDVFLSDATPPDSHSNHYLGAVHAKIFLGDVLDFQVQVNNKVVLARVHPSQKTPVGAPIHIVLDPKDCVVLRAENTH